jgi:16S rRNA (guanine1207-N2)-methyltransferase
MTAAASPATAMSQPADARYGEVPPGLVDVPDGAVQCSPRAPGATQLADLAQASLASVVMHAPANAVERRRELALALRALRPGGRLTALAANTKGGNRIASELTALGCEPAARHKHHHQIVTALRPESGLALDAAIEAGAPRLVAELGLWSQPGLFSWDHIDPGTRLLLEHLPPLAGRGADLGCGIGVIARTLSEQASPPQLTLVDVDARALDMARRNVAGDGVSFVWADVRNPAPALPTGLDFVVMNPPFHDGGNEDKALGQAFIARAAAMLRTGGALWLTANRHLPYEATLAPLYGRIERIAEHGGYKVYMAQKTGAQKTGAQKTAVQRTPAQGKRRR